MQGPPHSSQTELPICARRLYDDFCSVVTDWGFLSPQPACLALSLHSSISVLVCFTPSGALAAPPATVQGEHIATWLSSQSLTHWHWEDFLGESKDKCHFISLVISWYSIHNGSQEPPAHEMHNNKTILTKREGILYILNAAFFTHLNCTWVLRAWSFNFAPWEQLCNIPLKVRGFIFSHTGDNGKNLKSCLKSGKK